MTKLDQAIDRLKSLPVEMQEAWAGMILRDLEEQGRYTLTDEQVAEVQRRLAVKKPVYLTFEEAEERLSKLFE